MHIRICHVTSVHPYKDGRIFRKECHSLAKKYDVSLIAPNTETKEEDGIHVYGVELPRGRLKRMRSLDIVYQKMMEVDADVYHFHDPELIPIGFKVKKCGKKVIFDSHEDVPLQISEKDWIPRPFRKVVSALYRKYEESKLSRYDALISVTPSIVDRLRRCNPHTYQITNYPIVKVFKDHRTWNNQICFTGGVSPQWMHENVLNSIDSIDVRYVIAGPIEEGYRDVLESIPAWNKVDYKGVVTPSEVSDIQQSSFAGIALNDYVANVGYKLGSLGNTKLFEYMMSGIPVISTDFILWKEIVEKYECGICVNPRNVDAIKDAIINLKEHPSEAKRMGDNGRKAVEEKFNWSSQEKILFELYDNILES